MRLIADLPAHVTRAELDQLRAAFAAMQMQLVQQGSQLRAVRVSSPLEQTRRDTVARVPRSWPPAKGDPS